MKNLFLLFIVFFVIVNHQISAQKNGQQQIDSLLSVLPKTKVDTLKVKLLFSISQVYADIDQDKSIAYAVKGVQLAEKTKNRNILSNSYYYLGNTYLQRDDYPKAIHYLNKALVIEKQNGDPESIATIMTNISNVYATQSNFPKALEYSFGALKIFEKNGNKFGQANNYCNIAGLYIQQSDLTNGLKYFNKSLNLFKSLKIEEGVALIEGNMAQIFIEQKKYDKALESCLKSIDKYTKIGDPDGVQRNYGNLGIIYLKQKKYNAALDSYNKALNIAIKNEITQGMGYDYSGLSEIYFTMATDSSSDKTFYPPGENKNSLLKKAKDYADRAIIILQQIGDVEALANTNEILSKTLYELGSYNEAYKAFNTFKTLNDSIYNIENNKKLTQTGMQYEFDKKNAAAKAEQEKKDIREKNIRNTISGGLLAAILFLLVVYRQRNKIAKEKKRSEELLHNILPAEVALELKQTGEAAAKQYNEVTVLFTDFVNFTGISEQLSPTDLVAEIHKNFTAFDAIIEKHGLEKIKTIGDAYMAVCGLPNECKDHAERVIKAALEIREYIAQNKGEFQIRIGVNSGSVVAGIVGVKKFAYDIWGDTVNIASRMESNSDAGKINISGSTYELVKDIFNCQYRGKISAKGKGDIDMYFVE